MDLVPPRALKLAIGITLIENEILQNGLITWCEQNSIKALLVSELETFISF